MFFCAAIHVFWNANEIFWAAAELFWVTLKLFSTAVHVFGNTSTFFWSEIWFLPYQNATFGLGSDYYRQQKRFVVNRNGRVPAGTNELLLNGKALFWAAIRISQTTRNVKQIVDACCSRLSWKTFKSIGTMKKFLLNLMKFTDSGNVFGSSGRRDR